MIGALLIAMSMQLDRKGLWNLLGPILCAILLMVTSWVRDPPHSYRVLLNLLKVKSEQSHKAENLRLIIKKCNLLLLSC